MRELPVRGHAMVPEFVATTKEPGLIAGTVTFGCWFMGGGMAAHGGAIAPIDTEVQMTVRVDRVEGRKVFDLGQLWSGASLCAEADALFLTLLPGQQ